MPLHSFPGVRARTLKAISWKKQRGMLHPSVLEVAVTTKKSKCERQGFMKNTKKTLGACTAAMALMITVQAFAQSQMSGPNGIAASPRLRSMLNERSTGTAYVVSTRQDYVPVNSQIAASPRVKMMSPVSANSTIVSPAVVVVQSPAAVPDNLAASPRLRSQLQERAVQFQVAPLK